jgi:hypothetical protein
VRGITNAKEAYYAEQTTAVRSNANEPRRVI